MLKITLTKQWYSMTLSSRMPVLNQLQKTFGFAAFSSFSLWDTEVVNNRTHTMYTFNYPFSYLWHIYFNMRSIICSDFKSLQIIRKYYFRNISVLENNISFILFKILSSHSLLTTYLCWRNSRLLSTLTMSVLFNTHLSHGFIKIKSNFPITQSSISWDRGWWYSYNFQMIQFDFVKSSSEYSSFLYILHVRK